MHHKEIIFNQKNVSYQYSPANMQFIRHVKQEEAQSRELNTQKNHMTLKEPIIRDQISNELHKLNQKKYLEKKRIEALHQCEEMKEFNTFIQRAFTKREYLEQRDLKNMKLKEELQVRIEENKRFEEVFKRNKEIALEEERESIRKKTLLRQHLLKQIQEREKQQILEKESSKNECENGLLLNTMQQFIKSEDQSLFKLRAKLTQEKDKHRQNVRLYKNKIEATNAHIEESRYGLANSYADEQNRLCIERRNKVIQNRAAISERIGKEMLVLEMEKQKYNDVMLHLYIEERLAKDDQHFNMKLQKEAQLARSLKMDFHAALLGKEQKTLLEQEEENLLIKEKLAIFDDIKRKNNDLKELQLLRQNQYRQDLLKSIEFKKLQREAEASEKKKIYEDQLALEMKKRLEIEAEKLRLLKTLPISVLECLPACAISDEHRSILDLTCKKQNI